MNSRQVFTSIDQDKCIGCGACVDICPSETISMENGKAQITGTTSLSCGHCMAICPSQAISVAVIDPEQTQFDTFSIPQKWQSPGEHSLESLVHLMASRRSCRHFKEAPVPRKTLKDLIKIGTLAPSGTNCQSWSFTCLSQRDQVHELGLQIKDFFERLNGKAENIILRKGLKMVGIKALDQYYKEYYTSVKQAMEDMTLRNKDRLFHGAPALILIGNKATATCPKEDVLLASQNILLGAHAMGLGTCLIGFAVEAMKADARIKDQWDIPKSEHIHAVIALGYPNEKYQTITGRKSSLVRFP